ncbi:MAG: hypothetical protein U1F57_10635 [bacterium]
MDSISYSTVSKGADSVLSRISHSEATFSFLQREVDQSVSLFVQGVTHWQGAAAAFSGGIFFHLGKWSALRLASPFVRSSMLHLGAGAAGLTAEAAAFEGSCRLAEAVSGRSSLSTTHLGRQVGAHFLHFGILRFFGRAAAGQNALLRNLVADFGMVAGEDLSLRFQGRFSPQEGLFERLLRAQIFQTQFHAGQAALGALLSPVVQWERGLALSVRSEARRLSSPTYLAVIRPLVNPLEDLSITHQLPQVSVPKSPPSSGVFPKSSKGESHEFVVSDTEGIVSIVERTLRSSNPPQTLLIEYLGSTDPSQMGPVLDLLQARPLALGQHIVVTTSPKGGQMRFRVELDALHLDVFQGNEWVPAAVKPILPPPSSAEKLYALLYRQTVAGRSFPETALIPRQKMEDLKVAPQSHLIPDHPESLPIFLSQLDAMGGKTLEEKFALLKRALGSEEDMFRAYSSTLRTHANAYCGGIELMRMDEPDAPLVELFSPERHPSRLVDPEALEMALLGARQMGHTLSYLFNRTPVAFQRRIFAGENREMAGMYNRYFREVFPALPPSVQAEIGLNNLKYPEEFAGRLK